MRPTCLECAGKHLAQACENIKEYNSGYPDFHWWVIGQMAEAEEESIREQPDLANEIREYRVAWTEDKKTIIPFEELLAKVDELIAETEIDPEEDDRICEHNKGRGEDGPGPDPVGETGPTDAEVARKWDETPPFSSKGLSVRSEMPEGTKVVCSDEEESKLIQQAAKVEPDKKGG